MCTVALPWSPLHITRTQISLYTAQRRKSVSAKLSYRSAANSPQEALLIRPGHAGTFRCVSAAILPEKIEQPFSSAISGLDKIYPIRVLLQEERKVASNRIRGGKVTASAASVAYNQDFAERRCRWLFLGF